MPSYKSFSNKKNKPFSQTQHDSASEYGHPQRISIYGGFILPWIVLACVALILAISLAFGGLIFIYILNATPNHLGLSSTVVNYIMNQNHSWDEYSSCSRIASILSVSFLVIFFKIMMAISYAIQQRKQGKPSTVIQCFKRGGLTAGQLLLRKLSRRAEQKEKDLDCNSDPLLRNESIK